MVDQYHQARPAGRAAMEKQSESVSSSDPRRRRRRQQPWLFSSTALLLFGALLPAPTAAHPYPQDDMAHSTGFDYLEPRDCDKACGYNTMHCYTSASVAGCAAENHKRGWTWYTTTWTLTQTFTSTYSSEWVAPTPAVDCIPPPGSGQIPCGVVCCATTQYCAWKGQCLDNNPGAVGGGGGGGGGGGVTVTTIITTGGQVITTQYSAPYRVTSGATVTQTTTGTLAGVTTTSSAPTGTVVAAGGTAGSLSPGAIAGIVIGVLAGIVILILICACCIMRGLWHGLLDILGLRKKKRSRSSRETVIEEERYSRHGGASVHSRRDTHTGGWFGGGGGGGRPRRPEKEKKKSSGAGWLGLGAAAGTLLLLLGLRKDKKRKEKPRSEISSNYWSDSYTASSPSSASSRRTRDTRHSRATRTTRVTQSRVGSRAGSRRP